MLLAKYEKNASTRPSILLSLLKMSTTSKPVSSKGKKGKSEKSLKSARKSKTARGKTTRKAGKRIPSKGGRAVKAASKKKLHAKAEREADRRLLALRRNLISDIEADLGKFAGGAAGGRGGRVVSGKLRILLAFIQAFFPMLGNSGKKTGKRAGANKKVRGGKTKTRAGSRKKTEKQKFKLPTQKLGSEDGAADNVPVKLDEGDVVKAAVVQEGRGGGEAGEA